MRKKAGVISVVAGIVVIVSGVLAIIANSFTIREHLMKKP